MFLLFMVGKLVSTLSILWCSRCKTCCYVAAASKNKRKFYFVRFSEAFTVICEKKRIATVSGYLTKLADPGCHTVQIISQPFCEKKTSFIQYDLLCFCNAIEHGGTVPQVIFPSMQLKSKPKAFLMCLLLHPYIPEFDIERTFNEDDNNY